MRRRIGSKWMSLAVIAVASTLTLQAFGAGPSKADQKRARELFNEGVSLSDEGKWAEALEVFEQSDELVPSASVRFNIAATQRALGRYVQAKQTLERILAEEGKPKLKAALRTQVQELLEDVKSKVVVLSVRTNPTSASVEIDGNPMEPLADGRLELDPGKHVFVISAEGHETTSVTKTLSSSDTEIALTAPKKAPPAPAVDKRPVYKKGWFWATVGTVVAVGAAATVIAIVLQPEAPPPAGPPLSTVDRVIPAHVRF